MPAKKEQRKVELTTELNAGAEVVWKALTEAEELQRWFPLKARVKPGVNGEMQLQWGDDHEWKLQVREAVEHKYLKMVFRNEADFPQLNPDKQTAPHLLSGPDNQLCLEYFLETGNGRTFLRLVHSGFSPDANWDDEYNSVNRGWRSEMQSLKHYLTWHRGKNRSVAWCRVAAEDNANPAGLWHTLMNSAGNLIAGGNTYTYHSPAGERYEGAVLLLNPPWDFSGTVKQLNNALLRIIVEQYGPRREVSAWLSAYDVPAAAVKDFETQWNQQLRKLFHHL